MVLPLHIFEERYKLMINNCLAQDKPFGVVLIYSGSEAGDSAIPHPVGTVARIANWEWLPDGRINILTAGERRFRIVDFAEAELPYLEGLVEYWDDEPAQHRDLPALTNKVSDTFVDYLTLIMSLSDQALPISQLQLPSDPSMLSYLHALVSHRIQPANRDERETRTSRRTVGCGPATARVGAPAPRGKLLAAVDQFAGEHPRRGSTLGRAALHELATQ
jgi:ATP-dependent Lon protease